ncbi:TPA: tail fiber protein [Serratia marcescens]|nr:tail fiber protein [Serratia marcescens]
MAKNEFLPFGIAANANVIPNADYQALPARSAGFSGGVAKSEQLNTVWRQASVIASVVAQFIADNTGKDVLDDGDLSGLKGALKLALTNQVDEAIPPGIPFPWPGASVPTGWLKCNGDLFDKTKYPKLALAYPNGKLPDLRGEFIRGWDDGRGVDVGRGILTSQESTQIYDKAGWTNSPAGGYVTVEMTNPDGPGTANASFSTQRKNDATSDPGSTRYPVRPRNVAFCYIVRAA